MRVRVVAILAVAGALVPGLAAGDSTTTTTAYPSTTTSVVTTTTPPTAPCLTRAPGRRVPADARQVITVHAPSAASTVATLDAYGEVAGCWVRAFGPVRARVGRAGLRRWRHEGDETTPQGTFALGGRLLGDGPDPHDAYPYRRLTCGDWWDEDPRSVSYDELVIVPCGVTPPFTGEALWTETRAYPIFAVIEFNPRRVAGRGSGIFLHADDGGPTTGCVAIPRATLYRLLAWLLPSAHPVIAITAS